MARSNIRPVPTILLDPAFVGHVVDHFYSVSELSSIFPTVENDLGYRLGIELERL
jgi:hypothetical protein